MSIVIPEHHLIATRPIKWIHALSNQAVKSRVRPITHTFYQAVFDRIDMHIVHMDAIIGVIANQVLPKTPLPYTSLATFLPHIQSLFC